MTQIIADPTKTITKGDSKELHVNEKERMVSVASQESNHENSIMNPKQMQMRQSQHLKYCVNSVRNYVIKMKWSLMKYTLKKDRID